MVCRIIKIVHPYMHGLGFECMPRVSAKQSLYSLSTHTKKPKVLHNGSNNDENIY